MTGGIVRHRGRAFWISAVAGWAIIAWGLRGVLHHHLDTRPPELLRFVAAGILAHDVVFVPLMLAAGLVVSRAVPGPARALVQAVLFISGVVALFAYPEVRGYARVLHNPTSLPHNYAAHLAAVVVAVAGATAALGLRERAARPGAGSSPTPPDLGGRIPRLLEGPCDSVVARRPRTSSSQVSPERTGRRRWDAGRGGRPGS